MNIHEVIDAIGEERITEFMEFMNGQTVGILDGKIDYYEQDVHSFLREEFEWD